MVGGAVSVVRVIVFHHDEKYVSAAADKRADIKFKGGEKAFVCTCEIAVYIDLAAVVHTVKMQKGGFFARNLFHIKFRAVISRFISYRALIMRYGYAFPLAVSREDRCKVSFVGIGLHAVSEIFYIVADTQLFTCRSKILHEGLVFQTELFDL